MASDVIIEIFGTVSKPDKVWFAAVEAELEASVDWESGVNSDEFFTLLKLAEVAKRSVVLTRKDTNNHFDGLTCALQEAGLSYIVNYGPTGTDGFTDGFSWQPGMEDEHYFEVSGEEPTLQVREIAELLAQGVDVLTAKVESMLHLTRAGEIVIEPGFEEAYLAFSETWIDENRTAARP